MKKYTFIDSLKGIAILSVICNHCGSAALPNFLGKVGSLGDNGVQLFFIISAFLAYASLDHYFTKNQKEQTISSFFGWWKTRFIKLIPLYYLSLIISAFMGGSTYWLGSEEKITVLNFITHLFFLHGFVPHYIDSIIGVEWYLGTLAIFYLMVPFIHKYINTLEKSLIAFIVCILGCAFINSKAYLLFPSTSDSYIYGTYNWNFWIFAQLPVMFVGILIYFIIKTDFTKKLNYPGMASYSILIFSLFMLVGQMNEMNSLYKISEYLLLSVWFGAIIISQAICRCKLLDNIVFQTIGKYSYPLYLFHFVFINIYNMYLPLSTHNQPLDIIAKCLMIIAVTFLLALLLIRFYDKPIQKLLNQKLLTHKKS